MRVAVLAMLLAGAGLGSSALAQDHVEQVGGWTLSDTGSKPGDDSDRAVNIRKSIPNIDLSYSPSESNTGGSIQVKFSDCKGLSYSSGFGFDDPPADRAAAVRKEVHEAFGDFAKTCPVKPGTEDALMAGFGEAFAAVDKLMTDKPNIYPPEPPSNGQDSADTKPQGL
jgi:hypothetical protein